MLSFTIFCRVVDNLGDAGVTWRLARQLASEYGADVTLWIDLPQTLALISPEACSGKDQPVRVRHWHENAQPRLPELPPVGWTTRVVVSAFGCELPPPVRVALAADSRLLWVNLEYLSAEPWIDGCHALASRKPDDGAIEHFFYPGFTAQSGGLIRERSLLAERDAFMSSGEPVSWLQSRQIDARAGERRISLFCYPDARATQLMRLLADGSRATHLLLPEGVAEAAVHALLGGRLAPGECRQLGAMRVERFALVPQQEYDRLLWCCALNFVRGEDSWIRALWSGLPFIWQPYRQSEGTHRVKLDAFLDRFEQAARASAQPVTDQVSLTKAFDSCALLMRAWNDGDDLSDAWINYEAALPAVHLLHQRLANHLADQPDLASRLVAFCEQLATSTG